VVRFGEPQGTGAYAINIAVEDLVPLPRHFVDAVHVGGMKKLAFMHRQKTRSSVNFSGTGVNDLDNRIVLVACFKNQQLGSAIDVGIHKGIFHRIKIVGLPVKIEQAILTLDQLSRAEFVTNVGNVDANQAFIAFQIEEGTPVLRDKAGYDRHTGPDVDRSSGQVATD
jgi:hypothetical protein